MKNISRKGIILFIIVLIDISFLFAQDNVPFRYNLDTKHEVVLFSGGSAVLGFSLILKANKPRLSREYIEGLNKEKLNFFDYTAANQWSKTAYNTSNVLQTSMVVVPAFFIIPSLIDKEYNNASYLIAMYSEALLLNGAFTLLAKNTFKRPRPYLYNNSLSTDEKLIQREPFYSFFSGHTSFSFCSAVFLSTVFSDLYPESHWKYVVWSGSLLAASATAYLRYKSGMHYPSDLIAGAIVGSAIGYLVPVLHRNKESDVSNSHASSTPLAFNLKMNF